MTQNVNNFYAFLLFFMTHITKCPKLILSKRSCSLRVTTKIIKIQSFFYYRMTTVPPMRGPILTRTNCFASRLLLISHFTLFNIHSEFLCFIFSSLGRVDDSFLLSMLYAFSQFYYQCYMHFLFSIINVVCIFFCNQCSIHFLFSISDAEWIFYSL